jgi:hypothetical protein
VKNASQIQKRIVELEFPVIALMLLFLPSDLCDANTFPSDIKQKDPNKGNVKAGANIFQSVLSSQVTDKTERITSSKKKKGPLNYGDCAVRVPC